MTTSNKSDSLVSSITRTSEPPYGSKIDNVATSFAGQKSMGNCTDVRAAVAYDVFGVCYEYCVC